MSEQNPGLSSSLRYRLSQLLEFDTTSRESNLDLIESIQKYLKNLGIESTLVFNDQKTKANLYARLGPDIDGGVMLSGHTDVVPVDGQKWLYSPFMLTEKDGKCYGRGSTDMKGFIACVLDAIPRFLKVNLRTPLHLAFSYDEEVGCLGVRSLIDHIKASPEKPAMCIIGEPTSMRPIYGHKGKIAMRCKVHGHACHSAYAPEGVNAIEYAAKVINKLSDLAEPLKQDTDNRFDPPYSTLQIGTIKGGAALNIVPEFCQFDFEMRYLPSSNSKKIFKELRDYTLFTLEPEMKTVNSKAYIHLEDIAAYPPLLTDPQSEFAQWLSDWSQCKDFGTVAFGTEGGLFDEAGIATLVCGPGSMEQGHKPDEFVSVEQLNLCVEMLDKLCDWMTEDATSQSSTDFV